jgi:hypothetical protein
MGRPPIAKKPLTKAEYQARWRAKKRREKLTAKVTVALSDPRSLETNWHGWPPQVWDGEEWKPIEVAELAVRLQHRIEVLQAQLTKLRKRKRARRLRGG